MNYVNGGPNGRTSSQLTNGNGSSNILIVWDHGKTPGCADSTHAATPATPRSLAVARHHQPAESLPLSAPHERLQRPLLRRPQQQHESEMT